MLLIVFIIIIIERYVQTYRIPKGAEVNNETLYRGDTYDTALTCIYFFERGNVQRAGALADALYRSFFSSTF